MPASRFDYEALGDQKQHREHQNAQPPDGEQRPEEIAHERGANPRRFPLPTTATASAASVAITPLAAALRSIVASPFTPSLLHYSLKVRAGSAAMPIATPKSRPQRASDVFHQEYEVQCVNQAGLELGHKVQVEVACLCRLAAHQQASATDVDGEQLEAQIPPSLARRRVFLAVSELLSV